MTAAATRRSRGPSSPSSRRTGPSGPAVAGTVLLLAAVGLTLALVPFDVLPGAEPVVDVARDFSPAEVAREEAFHDALRPPAYASLVLGLVVAAGLGLTRLGSRLVVAVARPLGGGWVWQVLMGVLALGVVGRVVTLPLDVRSEQVLRTYGLSTQDWGSWAVDAGKGLLVQTATAALVLLAVLALARRAPRTWWAWGAGTVAGLVLAGSFAYPVFVEPVFNSFTPLPAGELREDLLALAARDGAPVDDVLVADASRRTTALNAYVSGFGSTRRIVLYDTLLRSASPEEVRLVVAHELGHVARNDVLVGSVLGALGGAAGLCLLAALLRRRSLLDRVGASGPGDPRVVPLVLAVVAVAGVLVGPAVTLVSRRVEARADLHSLQLTGDVETFVASERRLTVTNLGDLDPGWLPRARSSHPTGPERIALARAYAAQQEEQPR